MIYVILFKITYLSFEMCYGQQSVNLSFYKLKTNDTEVKYKPCINSLK